MYGWRAHIGLIAPTCGPDIERDFHRFAPKGISIATTRVMFTGNPVPEDLKNMVAGLGDAAKMFSLFPHDCIIFGCTSGSFIGGMDFDKQCIKTIEEASGSPGLTTSTAVLEAFKALGCSHPIIATPYPKQTNDIEKSFMDNNGVHCTDIIGMSLPGPNIGSFTPEYIYGQVKKLDTTGADCVFISCTGLDVLDMIPLIETDLKLPVITSIQASLWACLRHAKCGDNIKELGKLFSV